MKLKPYLISASVITIILLPLWGSHVLWRLFPKRSLPLLIVDYTVPNTRYSHHRGIIWLLNYHRVTPPHEGSEWLAETDYVGYYPEAPEQSQHLSEISLDPYEWIYLADTYGVYHTDIMKRQEKPIPKNHVPKLVFGALSLDDAKALSQFVSQGKNLILEFNSVAVPTEIPAREIAEDIMRVEWTGWSGRFFPDLSDLTELPAWFEKIYRIQHPEKPMPSGPGILFIHNQGQLVVLSGQVFEKSAPFLRVSHIGKQAYGESYGTPPYFGWFAIVRPKSNETKVLAELILPNHYEWRKTCRKARIPTVFPVITEYQTGKSTRIYLAANLANMDEIPGMHTLAGIPSLQSAVNRRRDTVSEKPAYWHIYVPLMGKILTKSSTNPEDQKEEKWRTQKDVLKKSRRAQASESSDLSPERRK